MRKLIAIILILAVVLPAAALAADRDPIVGCWYILFDAKVSPEMAPNFSGFDKTISVYDFLEDGTIMLFEIDAKDNQGNPVYAAAGKWSKAGNTYNYSIVGFGNGDAYVKDGGLYLSMQSTVAPIYLKIRKMEDFDPYSDYVY